MGCARATPPVGDGRFRAFAALAVSRVRPGAACGSVFGVGRRRRDADRSREPQRGSHGWGSRGRLPVCRAWRSRPACSDVVPGRDSLARGRRCARHAAPNLHLDVKTLEGSHGTWRRRLWLSGSGTAREITPRRSPCDRPARLPAGAALGVAPVWGRPSAGRPQGREPPCCRPPFGGGRAEVAVRGPPGPGTGTARFRALGAVGSRDHSCRAAPRRRDPGWTTCPQWGDSPALAAKRRRSCERASRRYENRHCLDRGADLRPGGGSADRGAARSRGRPHPAAPMSKTNECSSFAPLTGRPTPRHGTPRPLKYPVLY